MTPMTRDECVAVLTEMVDNAQGFYPRYVGAVRFARDHLRTALPLLPDDAAWLVESVATAFPVYWTCDGWSTDLSRAIRFANKQDAACVARLVIAQGDACEAREHVWMRVALPEGVTALDLKDAALIIEGHSTQGFASAPCGVCDVAQWLRDIAEQVERGK